MMPDAASARPSAARIGTFLALTFAATWTLWALVIRAGSVSAAHSPLLALGGPAFLLGAFAPGLVAVALTAWQDGREAVAILLGRILRWRVGLRFYAFALLLMPVVKLAVAGLHRLLTGAWPAFGETHPMVLVVATLLSTLGQAGEEVGWRGYLLPRVAERTGVAAASLIVGVVWAAWHLPLFFAAGAGTNGQSFPLYALQIVAYSIVLTWLYWRTGGSLLLVMFMHAALNNTKDIVPSAGTPEASVFGLHSTLVFRLTVALLWIVGAVLLVRLRGARFPVHRAPASPLAPPAAGGRRASWLRRGRISSDAPLASPPDCR